MHKAIRADTNANELGHRHFLRDGFMSSLSTCPAIERDPKKLSGAWMFRGTRVPVATLFENLRDGWTVVQFLNWFPGVERWQAERVLDHQSQALTELVA